MAQGILSELLPYMNVSRMNQKMEQFRKQNCGKILTVINQTYPEASVDENGNLVDGNGNLIDWDGNRIDENGYLLDDNGEHKLDDNGEYIISTHSITSTGDSASGDTLTEAISDTSVPAPPEDEL